MESNRNTHAPLTETIILNSIIHETNYHLKPSLITTPNTHVHNHLRILKKPQAKLYQTSGAIEMLHFSPKRCITIQQQPIAPASSRCATSPPPLAQGGIKFKFKCPHSSIHLSLWGSVVVSASLVERWLSLSRCCPGLVQTLTLFWLPRDWLPLVYFGEVPAVMMKGYLRACVSSRDRSCAWQRG